MGISGLVYLVHFEKPYKHAQHYLGFTDVGLKERFQRHASNATIRRGSALMNAVFKAGIAFKVVRTWPGDRAKERSLKINSHRKRCPVCRGEVTWEKATCLLKGEEKP